MATPVEQPAGLAAETRVLAEMLSSVPAYSRGYLALSGEELFVTQTQRDLEGNKPRSFCSTVHLADRRAAAFGLEMRGVTLAVPSPSGRRMLVVRNPTGDGAVKGVLLELWGGGRLLREVEVPPSLHGAVYAEGWFESVTWTAAEDRVCYAAEAAPSKRTPLWGGRAPPGAAAKEGEGDGWRGAGEYEEDWGEQLTGKRTATLFVVEVPSGAVHAVRGLPADYSCGQATWAPGDAELVFAAWPHSAVRRLGLIYCYNRHCSVWRVAAPSRQGADAAAVCLTASRQSCYSPRFNPSGTTLALLSSDAACATGAHNATTELCTLAWPAADGQVRSAVAVVAAPGAPGAFPGLYVGLLARSPWVSDTQLMVCSTWGSGDALLLLDVDSGAVRRLTPPLEEQGHWALLDVAGGRAVAAVSTPAAPAGLAVAQAPDWAWQRVEADATEPFSEGVEAALAALEWRLISVPLPSVEAILLRPKQTQGAPPPPCVLVPHGGPHSACVAAFVPTLAWLASQGYAVLQLNYRGSTGFGQHALASLLGRAGRQDVDDCLACLDAASEQGLVDGSRAAVVGGSHGGFLAAHLIGQAPSRFFCAALRNPVTDISAMVGVTDIPDWCFTECGGLGATSYQEAPSAAALAAMRAVSPVAHLDSVRAPVLMLLGAKDRRVPHSNGLAYAAALRQSGVPVRTLVFAEDEHPLSKPRTELESYANILHWLKLHEPKR